MAFSRKRTPLMLPLAAAVVLALAGCGGGDDKPKATQVAVKVNGSEISVHQLNAVLSKLSGVTQENAAQAQREVLGKLVDQQLAYDQAVEKKLDRNPDVMMAIESAKREIVARAYLEQVVSGATKPTDDAAAKYYAANPALFSQRKVYTLQEIALEKKPESIALANQQVAAGKPMTEIAAALKAANVQFRAAAGVKPAEQLPLDILPKIAAMSVGQTALIEGEQAAFIIRVEGAQLAAVDEATAKPRILQFLQNKARQDALAAEIQRLKSGATIEYMGEFAKTAAAPVLDATPAAPAAIPAAEAPAAAPADAAAAANLERGVKGLK